MEWRLNNQTRFRLDRFLIPDDWEGLFSNSTQSLLQRPTSDHYPILLDGGGMRSGPTPFRFENMWLKEKDFIPTLKSWWEGLVVRGSVGFIMMKKLKALKPLLKTWNRMVFGNVELQKKEALRQIAAWDAMESTRPLIEFESGGREEMRGKYKK